MCSRIDFQTLSSLEMEFLSTVLSARHTVTSQWCPGRDVGKSQFFYNLRFYFGRFKDGSK